MFLLLFLRFFRVEEEGKSFLDQSPASSVCCSIRSKPQNIAVFQGKGDSRIISVDPSIDGVFDFSKAIISAGYNVSVSSTKIGNIHVSFNNKNIENYRKIEKGESKYDFLYDVELNYNVISDLGCVDTILKCKESKNSFFKILIFAVVVVAVFLVVSEFANPFTFNELSKNVWLFDKNFIPLFKGDTQQIKKKVQYMMNMAGSTMMQNSIVTATIKQNLGISSSSFDRVFGFLLKSGPTRFFCVNWSDELPKQSNEQCPFDVKLVSKTKSLIENSEVYLKSFREIRPVRVNFELTTGQRGVVELPVSVITPLEPLGHGLSIITSIFLDCYQFMLSSPYSSDNINQMLTKYLPMIGATHAFFLTKGKVFADYHADENDRSKHKISKERIAELIDENHDKNVIECDNIPGVKWIFVMKTDSSRTNLTIAFCFPSEHKGKTIMFGLPVVALAVTFIYQMSLARQISLKYNQLINMIVDSKVFSFYEYSLKTKKLQLVRSDCRDILGSDADQLIKVSKPGELSVTNSDDKIIFLSQTEAKGDEEEDSVINILVEDVSPIKEYVNDMLTGSFTTMKLIESLEFYKITTRGNPELTEDEPLIKKLGYEGPVALLDVIHKDDVYKFKKIGQSLPASGKEGDWFDKATDAIKILKGAEKRFVPYASDMTRVIRPEMSKKSKIDCPCDFVTFRILDKNKFAHWFIGVGNSDIGFIFNTKQIIGSVVPSLSLKALSNAPSSVIIWGVVQSEHVVSVFEMPTIWDKLCIDKGTPFSNFIKFLRDPSPEVERNINLICEGKIHYFNDIVYLLRPGGVLRRGRLSITRLDDSLICAFLDLEEFTDTSIRVKEQRAVKSFLLKAGKMGLWRFQDTMEKADNKLIPGENIIRGLNWLFVDNEIETEEAMKLFTTRMRNSLDLGHAFEIDMKLKDGRYVALRGRQTTKHSVTGIFIDITKVETSSIIKLTNGKVNTAETLDAVNEIKEIFMKIDTSKLNEQKKAEVEEVIAAADEILTSKPAEVEELQ